MRNVAIAVVIIVVGAAGWFAAVAHSAYARAPELLRNVPTIPIDLPQSRLCALLAVQDPTFFQHRGIGLFHGKPGHTTITQSIAKWLYFDGFSPGPLRLRKLRLMACAVGLDRRISKAQQLRLFLDRTYFGADIHGFSDAARAYFNKDLRDLSNHEFLQLVAMLSAPNATDPLRHPRENAKRTAEIEQLARRRCRTSTN